MKQMIATIRSEFTKILTLPSVWIATGALLAVTFFLQLQSYRFTGLKLETLDSNGMLHWYSAGPVPADLEILADMGANIFNPGVFFPVLGAVIAGAEFRMGQLGISVLAVPNRIRLVMAKAIATTIYALGFSVVVTSMTIVTYAFALKDWRPDLIWHPQAFIGFAGSILFVIAITLISFAITLITRRTVLGILVMMGFVGTMLTRVLYGISPTLDALTPMSAARNWLLQDAAEWNPAGGPAFTSSPMVGGIVLAAWAILTPLCAAFIIQRRDAR